MRSKLLAMVFALGLPAQDTPEGWHPTWAKLRQDFHAGLKSRGVVGGSLYFVHGEKTLAREFHGYADLASRTAVDANTVYHWASITKTMTGIATMQLAVRKKLQLSDPIVAHIPELRRVHGGQWDVGKVTIRHLLSHSGGFRENTFPFAGGEPWMPYEPARWEQLAALFPFSKLHFAPGAKYSYSNPGIVFVGRTIEQLTGDDYEVYIDKNILKPLGMHRSFFDNTPYHLLPHRSNNYSFVDGAFRANGKDLDTGITTSNGGLNAPIPDMLRYIRYLVGLGAVALIPRQQLESMWKPQQRAGKTTNHVRSMGLTFFIYERGGHRVLGHTGSQKAFQAFFLFDPKTKAAAIAAFNSNSRLAGPENTTRAMMLALMDRLLDTVFPLFRS